MDTLREGTKTGLTNTNKLVRFYGCTPGLKTVTTNGAGYCISASATRNGMSFYRGGDGQQERCDERFSAAKTLLEYGYANYATIDPPTLGQSTQPVRVRGGVRERVTVRCEEPQQIVLNKSDRERVATEIECAETLEAPVEEGQTVGTVRVKVGDDVICQYPIKTVEAVEKMTIPRALLQLLQAMISLK
jgi:D-alanyl-D-alanine carboxypeptidase (penicillin-binding protein 5/6)